MTKTFFFRMLFFWGMMTISFLSFCEAVLSDDLKVNPYSSRPLESEQQFVSVWKDFLLQTGAAQEDRYTADLPFSFFCGDRSSREWIHNQASLRSEDWNGPTRKHFLTWTDEVTKLTCELELTEYADFPALEWVVYLQNDGTEDSPLIHDFNAIDFLWKSTDANPPILYRSNGSQNHRDDFHYFGVIMREVERKNAKHVSIPQGPDQRMSLVWLPFFNYQTGNDGIVVAFGWNGTWRADFDHLDGKTTITAGMGNLNTKLHPGERIRSPRIAVLYWQNHRMHGQNMFRQFLWQHHSPHVNGKPVMAPISLSGWGTVEKTHMKHIAAVKAKQIPFDTYWIDAAWYNSDVNDWWMQLGDWVPDKSLYPSGSLRPVSDAAADAGMEFLLWMEPHRAMGCTKIVKAHPEYFLRTQTGEIKDDEAVLVNLTDPKGFDYVVDLVSNAIEKYNVKYYREDYNINPGPFWTYNDQPERTGMTEIRYAENFYKFWDTLRERFPDLVIDNCASGGGRLELEALSRSIPLWRTDYNSSPAQVYEEIQNHSYDLSYWFASHGIACGTTDPYVYRNILCSGMSIANSLVLTDDATLDAVKKMVEELQRVKPYLYGDYYPLMHGGPLLDTWSAYHYFLADQQKGLLVAIRRPGSDTISISFDLLTIDPEKTWEFTDADTGEIQTFSGHELRQNGYQVVIPHQRQARLIYYRALD